MPYVQQNFYVITHTLLLKFVFVSFDHRISRVTLF